MDPDKIVGQPFEVETLNGFKVHLTRLQRQEPPAPKTSPAPPPRPKDKPLGLLNRFGKLVAICFPFVGRSNKGDKKKKGRRSNKVAPAPLNASPVVESPNPNVTSTALLQSLAKAQVAPPRKLKKARLKVAAETRATKSGITWDLEDKSRPVTPMRGRPISRTGAARPPRRLASLDVEEERRALRQKDERAKKARQAAIQAKVAKAHAVSERLEKTQERKVKIDLDKANLSVSEMKSQTDGMAWSLEDMRPATATPASLRPQSRAAQLYKTARLSPMSMEEDQAALRQQIREREARVEAARRKASEEKLAKARAREERREKNQQRRDALEAGVKERAAAEGNERQERVESRHQGIIRRKQSRAQYHVQKAREMAVRKRERDVYLRQRHQDNLIAHPESTPREFVAPEEVVQNLVDAADFWDADA